MDTTETCLSFSGFSNSFLNSLCDLSDDFRPGKIERETNNEIRALIHTLTYTHSLSHYYYYFLFSLFKYVRYIYRKQNNSMRQNRRK